MIIRNKEIISTYLQLLLLQNFIMFPYIQQRSNKCACLQFGEIFHLPKNIWIIIAVPLSGNN